jgi:hypothetical protein
VLTESEVGSFNTYSSNIPKVAATRLDVRLRETSLAFEGSGACVSSLIVILYSLAVDIKGLSN